MKTLILLYDDDCGICSKFSKIIGRLIPKLPILPMHHEKIMAIGIKKIGFKTYWSSFHTIEPGGFWTSESQAITSLATQFPFGKIMAYVTTITPVKHLLLKFLNLMRRKRKAECKVQN